MNLFLIFCKSCIWISWLFFRRRCGACLLSLIGTCSWAVSYLWVDVTPEARLQLVHINLFLKLEQIKFHTTRGLIGNFETSRVIFLVVAQKYINCVLVVSILIVLSKLIRQVMVLKANVMSLIMRSFASRGHHSSIITWSLISSIKTNVIVASVLMILTNVWACLRIVFAIILDE